MLMTAIAMRYLLDHVPASLSQEAWKSIGFGTSIVVGFVLSEVILIGFLARSFATMIDEFTGRAYSETI
jgi:hypothetical protein